MSNTQFYNSSKNWGVKLILSPPEEREISFNIPPSESIHINTPLGLGTVKLSVYIKDDLENEEMIWQGSVPININDPINISPENSQIEYDGMILPECREPGGCDGKKKNGVWLWIMIILILIFLCFIVWKFMKK